jgi:hypothetical protein
MFNAVTLAKYRLFEKLKGKFLNRKIEKHTIMQSERPVK